MHSYGSVVPSDRDAELPNIWICAITLPAIEADVQQPVELRVPPSKSIWVPSGMWDNAGVRNARNILRIWQEYRTYNPWSLLHRATFRNARYKCNHSNKLRIPLHSGATADHVVVVPCRFPVGWVAINHGSYPAYNSNLQKSKDKDNFGESIRQDCGKTRSWRLH